MKKETKNYSYETPPIPSKYDGPKFDAHVHLGSMKGLAKLVEFREEFNIQKSVGIVWDDNNEDLKTKFPNKFVLAKYFRNKHMFTPNSDPKLLTDDIEEIYRQGFPIVKFWFGPRVRDYIKDYYKIETKEICLSDQLFKSIFAKMEELGLILLIHVGDPDLWYEKVYQPVSRYGTKKDHLADFEEILSSFPKLKVLQAHFGSQPEDLENLSRWFETYPNYYVDSSSARWKTARRSWVKLSCSRRLGFSIKRIRKSTRGISKSFNSISPCRSTVTENLCFASIANACLSCILLHGSGAPK